MVKLVSVPDQGSKIGYWPPLLSQFTRLTSVNLAGCAIVSVPQTVCQLTQLQVGSTGHTVPRLQSRSATTNTTAWCPMLPRSP